MTAPAVIGSCWICEPDPPERRCGGWGCWAAPMPLMEANALKALTRPRPCAWCEQAPAMAGEGSNYCDECAIVLGKKRRGAPQFLPRDKVWCCACGQEWAEPSKEPLCIICTAKRQKDDEAYGREVWATYDEGREGCEAEPARYRIQEWWE